MNHRRPHDPVSMQLLNARLAVIHALMGMPNPKTPMIRLSLACIISLKSFV
jgi:hypothetical protein